MPSVFNPGDFTQELKSRLEAFQAIRESVKDKKSAARIKASHIKEATSHLQLSDAEKKELFRSIGLDSLYFNTDQELEPDDYLRRGKIVDRHSFIGVVDATIEKINDLLEWLNLDPDPSLWKMKKVFDGEALTRHLLHTTGLDKFFPKAELDSQSIGDLIDKSYPIKLAGLEPHIVKGLEHLGTRIAEAGVPSKTLDGGINVAEWNIRSFGSGRDKASLYYIAEIIRHFDLVGITELKTETKDLEAVMKILGDNYRVVYSDSDSHSAGNNERIGYIYDKRSVRPISEIGEIRAELNAKKDGKYLPSEIFWRSPYKMTFATTSSDLPFTVINAHIRYQDKKERIQPLLEIADHVYDGVLQGTIKLPIVMGDFNIADDRLRNALTSKGLVPAKSLYKDGKHVNTNLGRDKPYDTIATTSTINNHLIEENVGGVIDFGSFEESAPSLFPHLSPNLTDKKYTFQMSDHFPVWTRINVNKFNEGILESLALA